ncbi:MAG: UDP-glucose:tetrahydrobiopterin glucosyltransferase [Ilumatobacter sp.]|jgi:UDP-glucose:tetrahydrobiopterin glucosyltransferase
MDGLRVLIASTPVGPLGSGIGGGVELTLHNLVYGLSSRGHHVEVVAPANSLHVGERLHQIDGALQISAQGLGREAPTQLPACSVLAAMWSHIGSLQHEADVILNLAYDWLPYHLTQFLDVPVLHVVSMGSLSDAMDHVITEVERMRPGHLAVHSAAQAATFPDPSIFRVVGNGIVAERYDVQLTVPTGAPLGYVGRISPEKGLEDVAELSARTGQRVLVWGILQDEEYWHRIQADNPRADLQYQGFLPTDDLQAQLGTCAALVMTPKWVEAFGNVAIEAMAVGVPVIAYARGGPAEIVNDGVTGFVVPADDIDALVAAVGRISEIDRAACRQRVDDEYSSAAMADRVLEWIGDVLAARVRV